MWRSDPDPAGHRVAAPAALLLAGLLLGACGSDAPTPIPRDYLPQPATAEALPTATSRPTHTPEPTATPDPTDLAAESAQLPAGDEPVVQFARIENLPWEPEILAQMSPNFSMQANGYTVYRHDGGSSADGWYQTVVTPTLVLDYVQRLVDEVKVLEMAEALPEPELRFETALDGSPVGPEAYGIIYVKTADGEGRLILTQDQIENPSGPYADNLKRLGDMIRALEFWRANTEGFPSPEQRMAVEATQGWWVDRREPYSPSGALAFGTRGRGWNPPEATEASWPLAVPLGEAFDAAFGEPPVEAVIAAEDTPAVLRSAKARPPSFWGPIWRAPSGGEPYLVGIRPAIPGSNEVVIDDYVYVPPKRGLRAPGSAAGTPAPAEGDAEGP